MCLPRCLCKGAPEIDDAAGGKADDDLDLLAFERRVGLGVRVPNREYCHQNESAESRACLKHRYPIERIMAIIPLVFEFYLLPKFESFVWGHTVPYNAKGVTADDFAVF